MPAFIIFHVELPPGVKRRITERYLQTYWKEDVDRCIKMLFLSAEFFHPGCRKILLTDEKCSFNLPSEVMLLRLPHLDATQPALSRLRAQIAFLQQLKVVDDLVFLDYDMLINGSLDKVFKAPFDIGLTYRLTSIMPFNGGLFFVPKGHGLQAARFLSRIEQNLLEQHEDFKEWWGFQLSLLSFIGVRSIPFYQFLHRQEVTILHEGFQIHFLPGKIYNYTPNFPQIDPRDEYEKKKILHFKGNTGPLMQAYWEQILLPKMRLP